MVHLTIQPISLNTKQNFIFAQRQQYCAFYLAEKKIGTNYSMQKNKTLERIPLGKEHSPLPQGQALRWTGNGLLECKPVKTSLTDLLFSLLQTMHLYCLTQATETTTGTEAELPHLQSQLSSCQAGTTVSVHFFFYRRPRGS